MKCKRNQKQEREKCEEKKYIKEENIVKQI